MVIKEENELWHVRLGIMGEQAAGNVIYKPSWFEPLLDQIQHRVSQNHVLSELEPYHQGRNTMHLRTIQSNNIGGILKSVALKKEAGGVVWIWAKILTMGPHYSLFDSLFRDDPLGETWEFRLRCIADHERYRMKPEGGVILDENGQCVKYKSLIPKVSQIVTWDLYRK